MRARDIIEVEDPKTAFQNRWGNPGEAAIVSAFHRLGLTPIVMGHPKRNGKVICDEYRYLDPLRLPTRLSVCATIWREDSTHTSHNLSVTMEINHHWVTLVNENSKDPSRLARMLEYAVNFIVPKVQMLPWKEATRQAMALRNRAAYHIMVEASW